jgi:hypothetical protein
MPAANPSSREGDRDRTGRYDHVMPQDRTVLEHLLEGRSALVAEVERLTDAINELDAVIGRIDVASRVTGVGTDLAGPAARRAEPVTAATVRSAADAIPKARPARSRGPARKASSRKGAAAGGGNVSDGQKSIRVHVLEMLAADDRDFGLAEIIDRVHGAGIRAHDDAVRSITIKLMKDGKVERVGRGRYRLVRRGAAASHQPTPTVATAPTGSTGRPTAATPDPTTASLGYTPPLNLAQPWERPQA